MRIYDSLKGVLMGFGTFFGVIFVGAIGSHILTFCCPENNIAMTFWWYVPNYLLISIVGIILIKNQRERQSTLQKNTKVVDK